MSAHEIRLMAAGELEDFARLGRYAFGFWDGPDVNKVELTPLEMKGVYGLFVDGRIAARLRVINFLQFVRGVSKPMGGVASVSTFPEYRGRGFVRDLMRTAFEHMHAAGFGVSTLHPFRESFYARYGYVSTTPRLTIKLRGEQLAHHLKRVGRHDPAADFDRQTAEAGKEAFLALASEIGAAAGYHGYIHDPAHDATVWRRYRGNQHVVLGRYDGRLESAARYDFKGFADDGVLSVQEMHWRDRAARDRLLAFVAGHHEAQHWLWLHLPLTPDYQAWLREPTAVHTARLNEILMVRVVEVGAALEGLPAAVDGRLTLRVADDQCPWNDGVFTLHGEGGRLRAERGGDASTILRVTAAGLSALVYGALPVGELVHRGWLDGLDETTRPLLAAWFPPAVLFNPYYF